MQGMYVGLHEEDEEGMTNDETEFLPSSLERYRTLANP